MAEFTGERLIPGEVDADLFNEHYARYRFVRRLVAGARVLDAGCGVGYGTALLAAPASFAIGCDNQPDVIRSASLDHPDPSSRFVVADVQHLPFRQASFDCAVSFEVIEHLHQPEPLVAGLAFATKPEGLVILSTPNRELYELSRGNAGPNPYHHHEFTCDEFAAMLRQHFAHVSVFAQNHTPGISFRRGSSSCILDVSIPTGQADINLENAQFFLAVCSQRPLPEISDFYYAADSGNVLFEREEHIRLLESEIRLKNQWLEQARNEQQLLLDAHQKLQAEHDDKVLWAEEANRQSAHAAAQLQDLQIQLADRSRWALETIDQLEQTGRHLATQLEAKCAELQRAVDQLHATEALLQERTEWARTTVNELETRNSKLATELNEKCDELRLAIEYLHQAEETIAERTQWAQTLTEQVSALQAEQERLLRWPMGSLTIKHWRQVLRRLFSRIHKDETARK